MSDAEEYDTQAAIDAADVARAERAADAKEHDDAAQADQLARRSSAAAAVDAEQAEQIAAYDAERQAAEDEQAAERQANQDAARAQMDAEQAEQVAAAEAEAAAAAENEAAERAANVAAAEEARANEQAELVAAAEAEKKAAAEAEAAERAANVAAAEAARAEAAAEAAAAPKPSGPSASSKAVSKAVADVAAPESLEGAFSQLTDSKGDTNYVIVTVLGKRGNKLKVTHVGSGGFAEMKGLISDDKMYFVGMKVKGVDDRTVSSTRTKYVVATYIGSKVKTMQKAGGSTVKAKLQQAWHGISVYYSVPDLESFTTSDLCARLLQCGGAHKPTYYDFGDGTRIDLNFYAEHKHGGR